VPVTKNSNKKQSHPSNNSRNPVISYFGTANNVLNSGGNIFLKGHASTQGVDNSSTGATGSAQDGQ